MIRYLTILVSFVIYGVLALQIIQGFPEELSVQTAQSSLSILIGVLSLLFGSVFISAYIGRKHRPELLYLGAGGFVLAFGKLAETFVWRLESAIPGDYEVQWAMVGALTLFGILLGYIAMMRVSSKCPT